MSRKSWLGLALLAALASPTIAACGDDGSTRPRPGDDDDVGDDDDDAMVDAGPLMSGIFEPCVASMDCVETARDDDALCRPAGFGYASGSCSRRCDGTGCRANSREHLCVDDDDPMMSAAGVRRGLGSTCHELCQFSGQCADGEICVGDDAIGLFETMDSRSAAVNACIPWSCRSDGACAGDAVCSPGGQCVDALPTGDVALGEGCGNSMQCETGLCDRNRLSGVIVPNGPGLALAGLPTYNRCAANCILPQGYNSINVFDGPNLPQGSCGDAQVCFPRLAVTAFDGRAGVPVADTSFLFILGGQLGMRDPGRCFPGCTGDADCGEGLVCVKTTQPDLNDDAQRKTFGTGVCYQDPNDGL